MLSAGSRDGAEPLSKIFAAQWKEAYWEPRERWEYILSPHFLSLLNEKVLLFLNAVWTIPENALAKKSDIKSKRKSKSPFTTSNPPPIPSLSLDRTTMASLVWILPELYLCILCTNRYMHKYIGFCFVLFCLCVFYINDSERFFNVHSNFSLQYI